MHRQKIGNKVEQPLFLKNLIKKLVQFCNIHSGFDYYYGPNWGKNIGQSLLSFLPASIYCYNIGDINLMMKNYN